ncbi:metallophosphoesterase [Ferruginibacter paludis]|uniref:metallophosphoesterase family protein n=1 Tax=Ferruginibacter paludis TaxID=1310417 RepID=UPI0025B35D73|nr:metallophosphoesterase [Ferruginibacter paludis]MDN3658078.1 metallophosphoesterase [Ferruginibacter paludis]
MKLKLWMLAAVLSLFVLSCKKEFTSQETLSSKYNQADDGLLKDNPHLTIAVVSDIHYMHPSLLVNNGAEGVAFQSYVAQDPKLVQFSDPIFRNVLADLTAQRPDILLVPGDLTKDGEKIGHQAMAAFFNQLQSGGTKVYVMPGNHDINNAKAKKYDGNNDYPVEMTTKTDFETIYGNFGYNNAISRDANSLSYVVQPKAGLRIIAIDASRYEEYGPSGDIAAGRIKPATLAWALTQLALAKQQHITVFAMMHHNLVEHYAGQTQIDPGYVVEDNINIANSLMDAGIKIIFTGHYHANDITAYTHNGKELFDIETGSLVTNPSPYRIITMKENTLDVDTKTVQSIAAPLPGGLSFTAYSNMFLTQHLDGYFNYYLTTLLGAPAPLASFAAPLFRNATIAHFAGDEKMPPDQRKQIDQLATMSQQLAGIATTLWTDLGVKDNKTPIKFQ